jgi:hypothetical protein
MPFALNGQPRCACTHKVNTNDLYVLQLTPRELTRTVNLVAGRLPVQSDPDIFGVMLAIFGAATLIHLLVVSVGRRRHETGLLKAVGFVNRQVAATCSGRPQQWLSSGSSSGFRSAS